MLLKQTPKLQMLPDLSVTLSVGMATLSPSSDVGLEKFIEACDRNLQQAKSDGGNCLISS
ncbi:MAG: GGDEF domain-containing protein [Pseudanabaenales cyanobacterium]|nr:GGDEF domain-containing protein [Pseudanabaenales cyanobacterium]